MSTAKNTTTTLEKVTVPPADDWLATNRYRTDRTPHIVVRDQAVCAACEKPCLFFCPAHVFSWEDGQLLVSYEACLECGTCRIGCTNNNLEWRYPRGGYGIAYNFG